MSFVFRPSAQPALSVKGTEALFPVHRIYCVGRNYRDHALEMGGLPDREKPFFFMKPADAVVPNGGEVPYPLATENLHHEVELVVTLGATVNINDSREEILQKIYGYAIGIDLTRRDLQAEAKKQGRPWDVAKGFDCSAPVGAIHMAKDVGHMNAGHIWLSVNGQKRQNGNIKDMTWSVTEVIAELSGYFQLRAGDLIFTGTPAGVGSLKRRDQVECGIDGLDTLSVHIV